MRVPSPSEATGRIAFRRDRYRGGMTASRQRSDPGDQTQRITRAELDRVAVEAAPDPLLIVASDGRVVLENQRARQMFGVGTGEGTLVGRSVDDLLPESLRSIHARHRSRYVQHPKARAMGSGLELLGRRVDGTEVPVEVSLAPVTVDGEPYVVAAIRDLTERRATQASLSAAQERLSLVAERERIGRDLHDSVIQRLYGAGLALQAALDADPERFRAVAARTVGEIDDTIAEIRGVINGLQREEIMTGRLVDRVRSVVDDQAEALGIGVRLRVVGYNDVQPQPGAADAVVAVVRECVANAHRHGGATQIDVDIESGVDGCLRVSVRDDGVGFDPQATSSGHGLKNLRSRAVELGGSFTVNSDPSSGTETVWQIPMS